MDRMVDIFVALGRRLREFGRSQHTDEVLRMAMQANEWFSREDILMAIDAICDEMLDEQKLRAWASHYPMPLSSRRVAVIMAGNIPLVGFFDLLCVLMCGHTAVIKPAGKDSVLIRYVVEQLRDISSDIPVEDYAEHSPVDMVIATGGDAAARHFRSRYADIPSLIRGSRHSVAVLDGCESEEQMEALRRDIYTYNGLGCRNVSLIFVPRGWQGEIPHPDTVLEMKRGNYVTDKALLTMLGVKFEDLGGALAIESLSLPDSLSRIHYYRYDSLSEVEAWLAERNDALQCVVSRCVEHPRRVDFGRAQYPTLWDYADGIDVMKFLTA